MNYAINYASRIKRMQKIMEELDIDVLIGTRMVSVTFASGAFVPWRAAALVSRDGHVELINFLIDHERVRVESWSLSVGMTEAQAVGIGEMELRRLGSEYHWAVTGSSEAASGYRTAYPMCGTTQPTDKLLQAGDNVHLLHPFVGWKAWLKR